jgi:hypothetical protein
VNSSRENYEQKVLATLREREGMSRRLQELREEEKRLSSEVQAS